MIDRLIRIFVIAGCAALAISLSTRPRASVVLVSDNGIIPPAVLPQPDDAILDQPMRELKLENAPLEEAVKFIADAAHTKIDVHWKALESAGIDRQSPVSVHVQRCTVGQALEVIADSVAGGTTKLTSHVHGGTIDFSTMEELGQDRTAEVYDLRPLIGALQHASPDKSKPTFDEAAEEIVGFLRQTASPTTYGYAGSIRNFHDFDGLLIITEARETHRKIAALLTWLDAELRKQ